MSAYWNHPSAIIDPGAKIGEGTKIWHFSHVCGTDTEIGKNCSFGQNTYVGPRTKIGDGCRVQNNVSIYDLVELENDVFCGPSMVFTNVINPRAHIPRKEEFKKTLVKRGATFGANCTILCGIEVGEYALIGAGAVITESVPAYAIMVGVPGRHIGWVCQCGVTLPVKLGETSETKCKSCGDKYRVHHGRCEALK